MSDAFCSIRAAGVKWNRLTPVPLRIERTFAVPFFPRQHTFFPDSVMDAAGKRFKLRFPAMALCVHGDVAHWGSCPYDQPATTYAIRLCRCRGGHVSSAVSESHPRHQLW